MSEFKDFWTENAKIRELKNEIGKGFQIVSGIFKLIFRSVLNKFSRST